MGMWMIERPCNSNYPPRKKQQLQTIYPALVSAAAVFLQRPRPAGESNSSNTPGGTVPAWRMTLAAASEHRHQHHVRRRRSQGSLCVAGLHVVAPISPPVVLWFVIGWYPNSRLPWTNSRPTHNWRGNRHHYMKTSNTQGPLWAFSMLTVPISASTLKIITKDTIFLKGVKTWLSFAKYGWQL